MNWIREKIRLWLYASKVKKQKKKIYKFIGASSEKIEEDNAITAISCKIFEEAVSCANGLKAVCEEGIQPRVIEEDTHFEVLTEFLFLFLHLVGRRIFQIMDEEKRSDLLDCLEKITIESTVKTLLCQAGEQERDDIESTLFHNFNQWNAVFAEYKWSAQEGETLKKTIFWEFGKIVAETIGGNGDATYIAVASKFGMDSFIHLNREILPQVESDI